MNKVLLIRNVASFGKEEKQAHFVHSDKFNGVSCTHFGDCYYNQELVKSSSHSKQSIEEKELLKTAKSGGDFTTHKMYNTYLKQQAQ